MSQLRYRADHDLNEVIVDGVCRREPAVSFVRLRDLGLAHSSDDAVLAFAARENLIVVSHDVNTMSAAAFARINGGEPMAGLLLAHQRTPVAGIIESLILIWSASDAGEWAGRVEFLPI